MESDLIERYKKRRERRLMQKRKDSVDLYKWRRVGRLLERFDADEGEEQNNSGGEEKGGHGNTKLPYGLCARFGITVEKGWTPHDCWAALAGKGITPDGAFARLKKGEDPGTPDEGGDKGAEVEVQPEVVEPPKEPKKTVSYFGSEYRIAKVERRPWDSDNPYAIRLAEPDTEGGYAKFMRFPTKEDMFYTLKDGGVEEFADPDTGEIVNPKEMELPEYDFKLSVWSGVVRLTKLSIGYSAAKDEYAVTGYDLSGKKRKVGEYSSMKEAKATLWEVPDDKIKLTPAAKKREKASAEWLTSDKKAYIEIHGEKCGDLRIRKEGKYSDGYILSAKSEEGSRHTQYFPGKMSAIDALKAQGVEKAELDGEVINPQEYPIPAYKEYGTYGKIKKFETREGWHSVEIYGVTIDGDRKYIGDINPARGELFEDAVNRFETRTGISINDINQSDEAKRMIEERKQRSVLRLRKTKRSSAVGFIRIFM